MLQRPWVLTKFIYDRTITASFPEPFRETRVTGNRYLSFAEPNWRRHFRGKRERTFLAKWVKNQRCFIASNLWERKHY